MYKIYLDPSKETNLLANSYTTENEALDMLSKSIEKRLLKEDNMIVYINRNIVNANDAIQEYNNMNYDVYAKIETNPSSPKGFNVIVMDGNNKSQGVGQKIYQHIQKVYHDPLVDLGLNYNNKQDLLSRANNAPVIINIINRNNEQDSNWLLNNYNNIGAHIAEGIIEGLNLIFC